ncbi:DUF1330 domain-containing protein [Roseibium polysiphoniae]|uniref:DUF1330 domain-containing protein n=1 Tax=Roseibium polysiphoniae TaxID=2571221 RepID=A0ABR9CCM3_9HYPH|nr:DUF1330 domain-containing protein [Roseibium polysiphoniae]MBD8877649.1 DUF1330 domain-containing protein [Roseibium polysiphoniae]
MPKAYWVARVDVKDLEAYKQYVAANAEPFAKYGAKFLVRAGQFETMEGCSRTRNVVIEFPNYATAMACYKSPEYERAKSLREPASEGDLIIVEGYDGPQPGDG